MTHGPRVRIQPAAQVDIASALEWYGHRGIDLAERFLGAFDETMEIIVRMPDAFPVVHRQVRRALMRSFPYCIYYFVDGNRLVVIAVFHMRRDPDVLLSRD